MIAPKTMSLFLLHLCLLLLVVETLSQSGINPTDYITTVDVPAEKQAISIRQLQRGKPLVGVVEKDESRLVHFGVLPWQGRFPNLSLFLEATEPESRVQLYCLPRHHLRAIVIPNPRTSKWKSTAQGQVFISSSSLAYQESIVDTILPRSGLASKVARFTCAIHGIGQQASQFQLTLRLSFNQMPLNTKQVSAMKHIFEKCCPDEKDCEYWRKRQTAGNRNPNNTKDEVEFDFCHRIGSICNLNGELRRLDLNNYGLKCKLPIDALLHLTTVESLDLSNNQIQADIGHDLVSLGKLPKLTDLAAASNMISGDIGQTKVCKELLPKLVTIDLNDNFISGQLPACWFSAPYRLAEVYLAGNKLFGKIPDVFSSLSLLKAISLARNQLVDEMPMTIGKLRYLEVLDCSENNMNGPLPDTFSQLPSLRALDLSYNRFSRLPSSWYKTWNPSRPLHFLNLRSNKLRGELPGRLLGATGLETLDMSSNALTGPLFAERGMFPHLKYFNLSRNQLTESIPEEFASMGAFGKYNLNGPHHYFDLSFNQLSGEIPEFMYRENSPYVDETEIYLEGNDNLTCHRWNSLNYIPNFECRSSISAKGESSSSDSAFLESEKNIRDQLNAVGSDTASLFGGDGSNDNSRRANVVVGLISAFVALIVFVGVIGLIQNYRQRRARMLGLEYGVPDDVSTTSGEDEERPQQTMNGTPQTSAEGL